MNRPSSSHTAKPTAACENMARSCCTLAPSIGEASWLMTSLDMMAARVWVGESLGPQSHPATPGNTNRDRRGGNPPDRPGFAHRRIMSPAIAQGAGRLSFDGARRTIAHALFLLQIVMPYKKILV